MVDTALYQAWHDGWCEAEDEQYPNGRKECTPFVVPPGLYDAAVAEGLIKPDDPRYLRVERLPR